MINLDKKIIYTTNPTYYIIYQCNIPLLNKSNKFDEILMNYNIIEVDNICIHV